MSEEAEQLRSLQQWFKSQLEDERMASVNYDTYAAWSSSASIPFVDTEGQYADNVLRGMAADERRHYQYLQDIISTIDKQIVELEEHERNERGENGESKPTFRDYATPSDEYQAHPNW